MAKQNTAPTMKDVAKEAGVSLGTVSKVINGIPVGDEYRKKVEQAIKTLDYHINAYAKGLKNNRTYTVAVILPNLLNPFFSMVAHYINRALVNRGYRMLLCDTEYDYTKEQEMVQMVEQNKVDGIIALTVCLPTDVRTAASEVLALGRGVCQDHAHLFLACARALGRPARYVSGYLHAEAEHMASHAWTDVWWPGQGWVSIDVTNRQYASERHCRLAVARDYEAASPVRGVRTGGGEESMRVDVLVQQ